MGFLRLFGVKSDSEKFAEQVEAQLMRTSSAYETLAFVMDSPVSGPEALVYLQKWQDAGKARPLDKNYSQEERKTRIAERKERFEKFKEFLAAKTQFDKGNTKPLIEYGVTYTSDFDRVLQDRKKEDPAFVAQARADYAARLYSKHDQNIKGLGYGPAKQAAEEFAELGEKYLPQIRDVMKNIIEKDESGTRYLRDEIQEKLIRNQTVDPVTNLLAATYLLLPVGEDKKQGQQSFQTREHMLTRCKNTENTNQIITMMMANRSDETAHVPALLVSFLNSTVSGNNQSAQDVTNVTQVLDHLTTKKPQGFGVTDYKGASDDIQGQDQFDDSLPHRYVPRFYQAITKNILTSYPLRRYFLSDITHLDCLIDGYNSRAPETQTEQIAVDWKPLSYTNLIDPENLSEDAHTARVTLANTVLNRQTRASTRFKSETLYKTTQYLNAMKATDSVQKATDLQAVSSLLETVLVGKRSTNNQQTIAEAEKVLTELTLWENKNKPKPPLDTMKENMASSQSDTSDTEPELERVRELSIETPRLEGYGADLLKKMEQEDRHRELAQRLHQEMQQQMLLHLERERQQQELLDRMNHRDVSRERVKDKGLDLDMDR